MDAAIGCLQRYGFQKTGLGDIAAAAGITKPTIYTYFASRDDLLHSALQREGAVLGERVIQHASAYEAPAEQIVEGILFCLREIPNEPALAVSSRSNEDGFGATVALRPASLEMGRHVLTELLGDRLSSPDEVEEIAEVLIRWMLSLLTIDSSVARTEDELRAMLHRRMIPGLAPGLDLYSASANEHSAFSNES